MTAPVPALVLAGSRRAEQDAVARHAGVAHKCLAPVAGRPVLVRVLQALARTPLVGGVRVASDDPALRRIGSLLAPGERPAELTWVPPGVSPSETVATQFSETGPPLLVTTGDHALLSREILEAFLAGALRRKADLCVGLVPESVLRNALPESRRTFLRFRGEGYSGANLFLLMGPAASRVIAFWQRVERERKRPWRLVRAFGVLPLLVYLLRLATLDQMLRLASERLDARVAAVPLEIPEAAVDVDKPADLELADRLLRRRSGA